MAIFGSFGGSVLGILGLICAVLVIYDVFAKNKQLSDGMKILWTILAIVFSIITAIIYYFVYKAK